MTILSDKFLVVDKLTGLVVYSTYYAALALRYALDRPTEALMVRWPL